MFKLDAESYVTRQVTRPRGPKIVTISCNKFTLGIILTIVALAWKADLCFSLDDDDDDDDDDDGPLSTLGGVLAVDVAVNLLDVAPQPT